MPLAQRIQQCRKARGLSQAELAHLLFVSRQAVSKWESGRGYPDLDNLKSMAALFDVSVDYLLDEDTLPPTRTTLRHPIDVQNLQPYRPSGRLLGNKKDAAVKQIFSDAAIRPLIRLHVNTKIEEGLEWFLAFCFNTPFLLFRIADSLNNREAYYLVEYKQRQLLARVTTDAVLSQEIFPAVTTRRFTIGQDRFHTMGYLTQPN